MISKPVVLVTGGGSGIGEATIERFVAEGWRAIAVGRRPEPLKKLARRFPGAIADIACDITQPTDVENLFLEIRRRPDWANSITALVNSAGIYRRASIALSDDELWKSTFEINLFGAARVTKAALPLLIANRGVVINISSSLALRPVPDTSVYAASKAAMNNWTRSLALELAPLGVRASCICPGVVDTPIHAFETKDHEFRQAMDKHHPLGRIGQPSEIAAGVWALAGPGSEWTTGAVLTIDGGITLA